MMHKLCHVVISLMSLCAVSNAFAEDMPPAFEGRRLFVSHCQICHGRSGEGDGPLAKQMGITPANLNVTVRARSDTILKKIIRGDGRPTITGRDRHDLLSTAMPKWKDVFGDAEIDALIAYLRFLSSSKHELMGDPAVGRTLYLKYCGVCHGEEGSGDGIMTGLMDIEPMDHTNPNATSPLSNEQLLSSILDGKGEFMPAWRGVLSQNDVEALVSYIRLLAY